MTNPFDRNDYPVVTPDCIVVGRHVGWRLDLNYSDTEFGLKYVLNQIGGDAQIEITGSRVQLDDKMYWVFEVDATASEAWPDLTADAEFRWDLVMTHLADDNVATIRTGFINIFQSTSDRRSHAEIMLSKINSILEGRADSDVSSYSIKSRSISRMGVDELLSWRNHYIDEIGRTGGTTSDGVSAPKTNTVRVRFVS